MPSKPAQQEITLINEQSEFVATACISFPGASMVMMNDRVFVRLDDSTYREIKPVQAEGVIP